MPRLPWLCFTVTHPKRTSQDIAHCPTCSFIDMDENKHNDLSNLFNQLLRFDSQAVKTSSTICSIEILLVSNSSMVGPLHNDNSVSTFLYDIRYCIRYFCVSNSDFPLIPCFFVRVLMRSIRIESDVSRKMRMSNAEAHCLYK